MPNHPTLTRVTAVAGAVVFTASIATVLTGGVLTITAGRAPEGAYMVGYAAFAALTVILACTGRPVRAVTEPAPPIMPGQDAFRLADALTGTGTGPDGVDAIVGGYDQPRRLATLLEQTAVVVRGRS